MILFAIWHSYAWYRAWFEARLLDAAQGWTLTEWISYVKAYDKMTGIRRKPC